MNPSQHPTLPAAVDVVVIGGGIVGVTAARYLAKDGHSVALVEKGRIAAEQSSRNWGWIRKQGRDARELPLMIESARLWEGLAAETGEEIGFGAKSTTYLAQTEKELATRAAWLDEARDYQLDTRILSPAETDALLGRDDRRFAGALHTPSDMTAEPTLAVPAFARRAAAEGVTIVEGCAARGVETAGGRLSGVVTERGTIACTAAILGGGAWSRTFLENLGVYIPQLAVRSQAARTTPGPLIHPGGIGATGASLRRRLDGGYTLGRTNASTFQIVPAAFRHFFTFVPTLYHRWGMAKIRVGRDFFGPLGHARWENDEVTPMEKVRILDPEPDHALLADMLKSAKEIHPALAGVEIAESWGGMIDVTPDEIPIIDEAPGTPGLWIATGLSGHGFGIGPGVGRLAASLVEGRTPVVDPAPFRLSRFAEAAA
ncbi:FAD-binding oxidoreductase [Acuticoccus sp. I52.16.1]|uniref:NAD(P)/FAD-dependent oxidoreductase n=1 Tax=Acuticoccus sp. I52.16.1 TaxID=2928472 RepID=UPI001FD4BBB8|nr:FAD-binding oxidoreductase [Acuticoccus sp. I52.16.1]UOM34084.1 FAD-binding oxidoreductase [Acuticoccus sp. I52.16.1]